VSNAWTITKCVGVLLASLMLGIVFSFLGMLIVMAVNAWDDAPGGGILILLALAVGISAGVLCGGLCSEKLWRHRGKVDQSYVFNTAKGSFSLLLGCSLVPAVLILPWTGPHQHFRVELSALVAFALAGVAGWLIYRGARKLTATETVSHAKVP
jgi:hypothetical protein